MNKNGIIARISKIRKLANNLINKRLNELNVKGIVPQHGEILSILIRANKPLSMKEIVRKTGKAKSTITITINNLEKHGYVEKTVNIEDARSYLIKLTEKGKLLENHFKLISKELIDKVFRDIPVPEQDQVFGILGKIENNLR